MKQELKKESETLRSISFYGSVDVTKFDINITYIQLKTKQLRKKTYIQLIKVVARKIDDNKQN